MNELGGQHVKITPQGRDEIVINAPVQSVWPLIADSTLLPKWGPPVRRVEVFGSGPETVGSRRRVDAEFEGKHGYFIERRTEYLEGKRIAFVIEEDTFGLSKVMTDAGSSIDIEPIGPDRTRVEWIFFHNPKGLLGWVLNVFVIRRKQRANRLAALAALKKYAESP